MHVVNLNNVVTEMIESTVQDYCSEYVEDSDIRGMIRDEMDEATDYTPEFQAVNTRLKELELLKDLVPSMTTEMENQQESINLKLENHFNRIMELEKSTDIERQESAWAELKHAISKTNDRITELESNRRNDFHENLEIPNPENGLARPKQQRVSSPLKIVETPWDADEKNRLDFMLYIDQLAVDCAINDLRATADDFIKLVAIARHYAALANKNEGTK